MGIEQRPKNGWEPILESPPSDLFVCNYGGPFAQQLELNRGAIGRFLRIAALDGRVLLTEDKYRPPQLTPDLNPDGSITGRGSLRWGEKPQVEKRKGSNYYLVKMDPKGWTVSINGGLIMEELVENNKDGAGKIGSQFARRFNGYFRDCLRTSLLKDKLTWEGDPIVLGRILGSVGLLEFYRKCLMQGDYSAGVSGLFYMGVSNLVPYLREFYYNIFKMAKKDGIPPFFTINIINFNRRSNGNFVEGLSIPFELDRLVGGLGYLEWLKLKRQPLVRLAR